ncbi:protoporphyrinogen oxidase [Streptomyces sp. NPDC046215]|uniref:Coproporphyrinogen III oxidase n=1 Tax=Streptomyces stramineus TaxID=173861 RepID=A0ABN1A4Y9_9ACTN
MSAAHTHVVVIGGGISGLAAAHRLVEGGARVTLVEASDRLGGKLKAGSVAGVPVDLGAESMLARRPEAVALARAVGLGERLQPPAVGGATVWSRGAQRPMPTGHMMGVPGDLSALAASGVVSPEGLARIARDADLPPTEIGDDIAIGAYVGERLGREVVDRLVEPLLGGVYAGDAYRISLRTAMPQLFEAARTHPSLIAAVRALQARSAARQPAGPVFMGIDGGIGQLPLAVADRLRAAGAEILTRTRADEVRRTGAAWEVRLPDRTLTADALVVAAPAPEARRLLATVAPGAATELATVEYASMALITMAFRRSDAGGLPRSSGFLVPPVEGRKIKASTFASHKWGWIADAGPETFVLRTSIGRFGDEEDLEREDTDLVAASLKDLGDAVGLAATPVESRVDRWYAGLPQYPVGHLGRVARIRAHVAALPGLRVCGAAYDGVGIPACVAGAHTAADEILATLTPGAGPGE